jgi:hypothetical protein
MFAYRLSLALAATLAAAGPAVAQRSASGGSYQPVLSATDGRFLQNACSVSDAANRSFCNGYIFGIADDMVLQGLICRPGTANGSQIVNLVRSHLAASQADLPRHAAVLVRRVLAATYPCRR